MRRKQKQVNWGQDIFITIRNSLWYVSCYLQPVHQDFLHQVCQHFSSVQSLSRVRLFATPWISTRQASLSTYVTPFTTQSRNMVSTRCVSQWMSPYMVASQFLQSQRSYSLQIPLLLSLFSITSDIQMSPPLCRKERGTKDPLDESERGEWKSWLETQHSKN